MYRTFETLSPEDELYEKISKLHTILTGYELSLFRKQFEKKFFEIDDIEDK
jgi:hypothetical protein